MLVKYHYNANYIYGIPVKNYKGLAITEVWKELYNIFAKAGVTPKMFILDNKISKELIEPFSNESIT